MFDLMLYTVTVASWGSSWLAVKLHLGVVAPEASLVYRFAIAAALLHVFCLATGRRLRFPLAAHRRFVLQGLFLFCLNYWLVYLAYPYLTSGLVAVGFSTLPLWSIGIGVLFFGLPFRPRVLIGALLGIGGLTLIFWPEVAGAEANLGILAGLGFTLAGTVSAAFGMLTSGRNQQQGLPVVQTNAWGMAYGTLFCTGLVALRGVPFAFDPSPVYVGALLFLAVVASVVAFGAYLTLVGRIGADRAAYASVLFPIVALALSTVFEGYAWTWTAGAGVALVLAGNGLVLVKPRES